MVLHMMSRTDLLISFWGYALETNAFLLNRIPSKVVEKTPYELWTGKRPGLSFLKIWGCDAYVKRHASDKLASKSDKLPPSLPWKFYKTHSQLLSRHLLHKAHEGPLGFIMSPRDMDFS